MMATDIDIIKIVRPIDTGFIINHVIDARVIIDENIIVIIDYKLEG